MQNILDALPAMTPMSPNICPKIYSGFEEFSDSWNSLLTPGMYLPSLGTIPFKLENLDLTDDEFDEKSLSYINEIGYDNDIEKFIKDCGERFLNREVNKRIVMDYLYEQAVINEE